MFILGHAAPSGTRTAYNIEEAVTLSLDCENLLIYSGPQRLNDANMDESVTAESLKEQFSDIMDAYSSDAKIYDLDAPIGAWKKSSTTRTPKRQTAAKSKAKEQEQEPPTDGE